ncbi:MAG TPA: branched-chain amino acid ABC transporter permease [Acidimicrobiia bacterium]|nr:branched-chain amino acid ABC transporter permease [Acidimicrobiia bacterium]
MRGRPMLYTRYETDQALMNTGTKKLMLALFLVFLILVPLGVIPGVDFLAQDEWLRLLSEVSIYGIAALGLNVLTGLAGQVSLGHAFFMGVGAYTAAWLGAAPGPFNGLGLPIWIWLPAAGIVAAVIGVAVGPTAVRVRGLYLAFVTLGLVFVGEYVFRNWTSLTGGAQTGRTFPPLEFRLWKEETPLIDFVSDGPWFGIELSGEAKTYYLLAVFAIVFVVLSKNLQRTRVGRAFQSIRDRDVAAEIMGVNEAKYKLIAFGISSFYAGIGGALLASFVGRMIPEQWNLFLSVEIIAIVLIGGAGVVTGTILGSVFVILLPRIVEDVTHGLAAIVVEGSGPIAWIGDLFISTGLDDFGFVNTQAGVAPGLSIPQFNQVLYGLLIILFLIFEPLGLYGIWLRIRNYWKGWPFTY